jgi:photosystem II stability/assembly factor-like uncharacterized protein
MKKGLTTTIIALLAVTLSGCGSSTNIGSSIPPGTYAVSKSIWKSEDGGATWTAKNVSKDKLSVTDLDVFNIVINPYANKNILVGLKFGGYIKSDDGGNAWQKTIFISERAYGLAYEPENPSTIYASGIWQGRGKIFRSDDSGISWKEIFTEPTDGPFIVSLNIDSKNPKIIYATTSDNQALKSEDGGTSWKNIYHTESPVTKLSIDATNSNLLYAITLNGQIFRSSDGGTTFEDIRKNLSGNNSFSSGSEYGFLKTDPKNSGWVYLTGKSGITRSKDSGNSWEKIVTLGDPKSSPVTALAINPKNSQEIIYGSDQATYRSTDGGNHWITSQFDTTKFVSAIEYDPSDSNIIYVGFKKQ